MMSHPFAYSWLFSQSLSIIGFPPAFTTAAVLTLSLLCPLIWRGPFRTGVWKRQYWLALTHLMFFPLVVTVGYWYAIRPPAHSLAPSTAGHLIDILFYGSLALSCFWIYQMRGLRWFAFSSFALYQVFLFGATLVAGMAVSGDWL